MQGIISVGLKLYARSGKIHEVRGRVRPNIRLSLSLAIYLVWVLILVGRSLLGLAEPQSLDAAVSNRVGLVFVLAPLFLLVVTARLGWQREVGLRLVEPRRSWRLVWLPAVFIVAFLVLSVAVGLPPTSTVAFVLVNTLLVGVSEELMFRGILFYGLRARLGLWAALWLTTLLFGATHALNGFVTGDFTAAFVQAASTAMIGVWFIALRLRTRSLYPVMLVHGLWDFAVFMVSLSFTSLASLSPALGEGSAPALLRLAYAGVLNLPLFLYGLWLLRGVRGRHKDL